MTEEEFAFLLPRLQEWTDYLYFHVMGEPLFHPKLERFLEMAGESGFKVILTTNGTLLPKRQEMLLHSAALHKVNISLHAFEANDLKMPFDEYLKGCFDFGKAAEGKKLITYRLWNAGGLDEKNREILDSMHLAFPESWVQVRKGTRIADRVYLEHGDKFDWPDLNAPDGGEKVFCYGLKDQIGVLCDGTVIPCCLDHEGDIPLGNLFRQELGEILADSRAKAMYEGFCRGQATEELCRKCGYARRFGK
jgi:MoaA/NifB/PqqE/SkfB family radical SAM enzyme